VPVSIEGVRCPLTFGKKNESSVDLVALLAYPDRMSVFGCFEVEGISVESEERPPDPTRMLHLQERVHAKHSMGRLDRDLAH